MTKTMKNPHDPPLRSSSRSNSRNNTIHVVVPPRRRRWIRVPVWTIGMCRHVDPHRYCDYVCHCARFACQHCAAESHGRHRQHKQHRYYYYYEQYEYYLEERNRVFLLSFDHTPAASRGVCGRWSRGRLCHLSGIGEIFGSIKCGRRVIT